MFILKWLFHNMCVYVRWRFGSFTHGCTNLWKPYEINWVNWKSYGGLLTTNLWDILRIVARYSRRILWKEGLSWAWSTLPYIVTLSVKISRFRRVKQLRRDTFRFTKRRFQKRVRINEVNLSQRSVKLGTSERKVRINRVQVSEVLLYRL